MDIGVGSFVFSMGIVSALPLLRSPSQRFQPLRAQLLRDIRRSVPLFLLGFIRVIMVKGVEYPEHISEYGVHWNFFITLALMPFFGTLCRPLARVARYSVLGLALSCSHQALLSFTELGSWTTSNTVARKSLLSQNKEGIVSFPGYLALFFLGMDLGHYVLPNDPYLAYRRPSRSRGKEKTDKLAMLLASFSILWWAAFYIVTILFRGDVSRRLVSVEMALKRNKF
jgi:phosphatidylinositol glycan class W